MSQTLLAMALAPILGLFITSIGNGLISSLTSLRLDAAGESATVVGIVSSAYFIGLTLGAFFNDRLIIRTGHIRAYSSFASLTAATLLLQALITAPWGWFLLRLINGWATVGVFLVVESWLLLAADKSMRGRLLALYMIAYYGSTMIGQAELGYVASLGGMQPFMIAALLASLSVLPIVIIPRVSPLMEPAEPVLPHRLLKMTPTGFIGSMGSGVALAAVYTLLPLYLQRIGLNVDRVGHMMACVIFGAMLLQYPVGRWSDRHDRQSVLIALCAFCTLLSAAMLLVPLSSPALMGGLFFLFGGGVFALYPVSVSHAADRASASVLVRIIQGLLLINSLGSAISPLLISPVMTHVGANGLFWAFAVLHVMLLVFFIWRRAARPAPAPIAPFEPATQMSPIGAELRVTDDMVQGALNHEAHGDTVGMPSSEP